MAERVFAVLEAFRSRGGRLALTDVTAQCRLPKASAFRLLETLRGLGYLARDDHGRYRMTCKLMGLATDTYQHSPLHRMAMPILEDLRARVGETVNFAVPEGRDVVYAEVLPGARDRVAGPRIGARVPMHATALGKAIAAWHPRADIAEWLSADTLVSLTSHTITSGEAMSHELARVRKVGYAVDAEEESLGCVCVAAPVIDSQDRVVGAVSVSGPAGRIRAAGTEGLGHQLRHAGGVLSRQLGSVLLLLALGASSCTPYAGTRDPTTDEIDAGPSGPFDGSDRPGKDAAADIDPAENDGGRASDGPAGVEGGGPRDAAEAPPGATYFPVSDSQGGWRATRDAEEALRLAGMDLGKLEEAFAYVKASTFNGGLLVVRNGWLVFERYFGRGHHEASPDLASIGKPFTSIAVGILLHERPDMFPDGLEQKIWTPKYLPAGAFPLTDPAKADIKLGHLLAMTAGIRGQSPGRSFGKYLHFSPEGPDGDRGSTDAVAFGYGDGSAKTLLYKPGEGWSYATASSHLASVVLRHVTGMELGDFTASRLAEPMGWSRWGYGNKNSSAAAHTPGGGGIAMRGTDLLRFGYLLLNEGRWNDKQLVPAEYVRQATNPTPYNPHHPSGLQFDHVGSWIGKAGAGGHHLYIVPARRLIVVKLGGIISQYDGISTGIPPAPRTDESRPGFMPTNDGSMTLDLVRAALVGK